MRKLLPLGLLVTPLLLAGCYGDGYGGVGVGYYGGGPYAYDGFYDGFYGPVYDGYWGTDGYYYYRHGAGDRYYVRGDRDHFRHDRPDGDGGRWQAYHHQVSPQAGYRMPHFSGSRGGYGGHGGDRGPH